MKFSIENGFFILGPSLATEKQGLGLKFSIENEIFKPRMKISIENENFVRGGMVFSCVQRELIFSIPEPSGIGTNRGIPENKERGSEQIGRKRGKIGTDRGDPLLPAPNWGLRSNFRRFDPPPQQGGLSRHFGEVLA